jgi:N-acetylglucosamine-6-phosphate deacetylase
MNNANSGELSAWHNATRQPVLLRWRDGVITDLRPAVRPPSPELWIAPPLFDLQINGFAGVDFQQDGLTAEDLLQAVRGLRASGCTRFLLTLITDSWQALTARLRHLRALRGQSAELQAAIAGWHVEGPFLSAEPGFHGAHDPSRMADPTLEHVLELRSITGNDPLLLTLAPERRGAIEVIALAVSRGVKVSLGHTDAPAKTLAAAVKAGATGFTHLGNACPLELDRHDNILWRVLDTPGLTVSLIPDRIHVSPPLFRLVHRALDSASIYYTTDAMSAAGAPPGRYRLGRMELEVGADQIVRQPGKTNFAGSAARPIEVVFRAAEMLAGPWQEAWGRLAQSPAGFMGLQNELAVGQRASFCVLKLAATNRLLEMQVYAEGKAAVTRL